jgi:hypothetical protein
MREPAAERAKGPALMPPPPGRADPAAAATAAARTAAYTGGALCGVSGAGAVRVSAACAGVAWAVGAEAALLRGIYRQAPGKLSVQLLAPAPAAAPGASRGAGSAPVAASRQLARGPAPAPLGLPRRAAGRRLRGRRRRRPLPQPEPVDARHIVLHTRAQPSGSRLGSLEILRLWR